MIYDVRKIQDNRGKGENIARKKTRELLKNRVLSKHA